MFLSVCGSENRERDRPRGAFPISSFGPFIATLNQINCKMHRIPLGYQKCSGMHASLASTVHLGEPSSPDLPCSHSMSFRLHYYHCHYVPFGKLRLKALKRNHTFCPGREAGASECSELSEAWRRDGVQLLTQVCLLQSSEGAEILLGRISAYLLGK